MRNAFCRRILHGQTGVLGKRVGSPKRAWNTRGKCTIKKYVHSFMRFTLHLSDNTVHFTTCNLGMGRYSHSQMFVGGKFK